MTMLLWMCLCGMILSSSSAQSIPDKSVIWSTGTERIFYSPNASNWVNAQLTPNQFSETITNIKVTNTRMYGMAADVRKQHLLIVEKSRRSILLLEEERLSYFHIGTSPDIGQLAVDWRGRNVYWTDTGYGWIAMKKLPRAINVHDGTDHRFKVIVDKYLQRPTGIAVHPHKFYLFWADKGGSPQIERSDLVGEHRKIVIWQGMMSPTTLCIDMTTDRLYWSDPGRGTVEYSDLDGNGRTILMSDHHRNYYGIAVFQDSLIYTVPVDNLTGYVSLRENNEGEQLQAILRIADVTFYNVLAYDTDLQPREDYEGCDSNHPEIACDQICLHMPQDQGRTCLCNDGYELVLNQNCSADEKIIQRHILFTYKNDICAMPISVLGLEADDLNKTMCNLVTSDKTITRFSLDMTNKIIFFTDGSTIYKQKAFKQDKVALYNTTTTVIDMDYDWKTKLLYWIQSDDTHLYNMNVDTPGVVEEINFGDGNATSIAVDPHNRQIFWIAHLSGTEYRLYKWIIDENEREEVPTNLLSKPTDLEYDRIRKRLIWNDNSGYIGMINVDSTGETKYDIHQTTGQERMAVAMYKNYILSTSEENRQFEVIYELDMSEFHITLSINDGKAVQDLHVYESSLQPTDLEPCEKDNNGGCEQICVPNEDELKCECLLGYVLGSDGKSCIAEVLETNYYVALDSKHGKLYQIDRATQIPHSIEIDDTNHPSAIAFDSMRKTVVWVDAKQGVVKKKVLGKTVEVAMKTGVDEQTAVAVDESTGNIYVSTHSTISVINDNKDSAKIVDNVSLQGTIGKITLQPNTGKMAWFEFGSATRIVLAYMDGSNIEVVLNAQDEEHPDDLTFDLEDVNWLYWCDSGKDTVSRIDLTSFTDNVVYSGRDLNPVAIDVVDSFIYLVPKNSRKIIRLDKNTGLDQTDVFESPLFGTFTNFFVFRDDIVAHKLCGDCNGGCSNICLSVGTSRRRCTCADGTNLQDDGVTCELSAVCKEETYTDINGLESLNNCCPTSSLHKSVCEPKCRPEYELSTNTHVSCLSGTWNVPLNKVCKKPDPEKAESLPIIYIAAGVGGGAALIIVIIVIVCVCRKKKGADKVDSRRPREGIIDPYASTDVGLSPDPPPRHSVDQVVEEEYHYLDEAQMVDASKLTVDLPNDSKDNTRLHDSRRSSKSDRYSRFPEYNAGYLTASQVGSDNSPNDRNPDYIEDGYLVANSISGSSIKDDYSGGSFDQITIRYDRDRDFSNESNPLSVRYLPHNGAIDRQPPSAHPDRFHGSRSGDCRSGPGSWAR